MTESSAAAPPHLRPAGEMDSGRRSRPALNGVAMQLAAPATLSIDHFAIERQAAETAVEGIRATVERTPPDQTVLIVNEPIPSAGHAPYFGGWDDIYTIHFRRPFDWPVIFIDRDALWWHRALGDSPLTRLLVPPPERSTGEVATPVRLSLMCGG